MAAQVNSASDDPFEQLAAPVPDLASTLTASDEHTTGSYGYEIEGHLQSIGEREALTLLREGTQSVDEFSRALLSDNSRDLRMLRGETLNRQNDVARTQVHREGTPGLPPNRQTIRERLRGLVRDPTTSYQGWAPGTSEDDLERSPFISSQVRHSREYYRDTATRRHRREQEQGQGVRNRSRQRYHEDQMDWRTSDEADSGNLTPGGIFTNSSSLRAAALLQSVRRQARFSLAQEIQSPDPDRHREAYNQLHRLLVHDQADRRLRQNTSSNMGRPARVEGRQSESDGAKWLEEAIKYLERLRTCNSHSDRLSSAAAGGFLGKNYFNLNHEDFILDTRFISRPKPTSWLRSGGVFSGSQHASGTMPIASFNMTSARRADAPTAHAPLTLSQHPLRSTWISNVISRTSSEKIEDNWPVRVTVTSIDYTAMTMTGTMEAFNVPNKTSPPQESSITTYLEGEIIDFNLFTLETKGYDADSEVDSTYWRKLEPFKSLSDNEVVSNLVSLKWLCEELGQKWILMRWKGSGLPIIADVLGPR